MCPDKDRLISMYILISDVYLAVDLCEGFKVQPEGRALPCSTSTQD